MAELRYFLPSSLICFLSRRNVWTKNTHCCANMLVTWVFTVHSFCFIYLFIYYDIRCHFLLRVNFFLKKIPSLVFCHFPFFKSLLVFFVVFIFFFNFFVLFCSVHTVLLLMLLFSVHPFFSLFVFFKVSLYKLYFLLFYFFTLKPKKKNYSSIFLCSQFFILFF